jgi:hypothetical protein
MADDDRTDRIRSRAYALWEADERRHGRHDDHWRQAEAEIDGTVGRLDPPIRAQPAV